MNAIYEYKPLGCDVSLRDPIDINCIQSVCQWMRAYWKDCSGDHNKAFMIGFYQISQAMAWEGNDKAESNLEWASCVLHVIGACEVLGGSAGSYLPCHFSDISYWDRDTRTLLHLSSQICQSHIYSDEPGQRRERFDINDLAQLTARLVVRCLGPMAANQRVSSLTGALQQLVNVEYMK